MLPNTALRDAPESGSLFRDWRARRRRSQMDVALAVGVSPRHLSFIETGRSRPSAQMVLAVAEELDVPLRERNRLLMAAGHAPRFDERALGDQDMSVVTEALQRLLDAHHPYPGYALDGHWNVVLANASARQLLQGLPAALTEPQLNVFRVGLHPQGLASLTSNFGQWGAYLLRQLRQFVAQSPDPFWEELEREVMGYETVRAIGGAGAADPAAAKESATHALLMPCVLELPVGTISMFTTLTTFGTPRDITLEEMCIELFYPSDATSEARLRAIA